MIVLFQPYKLYNFQLKVMLNLLYHSKSFYINLLFYQLVQ